AVGQGCVAVEIRRAHAELAHAVAAVDHAATRASVTVERAFLAELGSGCSLPVGAYARGTRLNVFLGSDSGDRAVADTVDLSGDFRSVRVVARAAAHAPPAQVSGA